MTKFAYSPRTGRIEIQKEALPNANQLFTQVKRQMHRDLQRIEMSDVELRTLVTKIMAGTRNIMYLANDFEARRRIDPIVRAINNNYPM